MINADMSKLETLMRTLFPYSNLFVNVVWDSESGHCLHYLDRNNRIECTVSDTHCQHVKYSEVISGDWRAVMDKIISVAESVGVQSVFYQ